MLEKKLLEKYKDPKIDKPILNAVIDREDKENLDNTAKDNNISVSKLVRIIIKEFFEKQNASEVTIAK